MEAFGHHHHHQHQQSPSQHQDDRQSPHCRPNIHVLAKKTSSSDNLIGYSGSGQNRKQTPEALVKDVELALRYFKDAVHKGTHDQIPGCASVVLERVSAIQEFVCYGGGGEGSDVAPKLSKLFSAVSELTAWADAALAAYVSENVADPEIEAGCRAEEVVEPVRRAAEDLLVALQEGRGNREERSHSHAESPMDIANGLPAKNGNNGLHNSLPDINQAAEEAAEANFAKQPKRSSDAAEVDSGHRKCHRRHRRHHHDRERHLEHQRRERLHSEGNPPPLPPKHGKVGRRQQDQDAQDAVDWFSNPLFERKASASGAEKKPAKRFSLYETCFIDSRLPSPPRSKTTVAKQRPIPLTLEPNPTLPDSSSFPFMDEEEMAEDFLPPPPPLEPPLLPDEAYVGHRASLGPPQRGMVRRQVSNSADSPPALPRKETRRKRSTYDNVASEASAQLMSSRSFDCGDSGTPTDSVPSPPASVVDGVAAIHLRHLELSPAERSSSVGGGLAFERRLRQEIQGQASGSQLPPPLPPKKRDIINYMEMLGQSLLPSSETIIRIGHSELMITSFRRGIVAKPGSNAKSPSQRVGGQLPPVRRVRARQHRLPFPPGAGFVHEERGSVQIAPTVARFALSRVARDHGGVPVDAPLRRAAGLATQNEKSSSSPSEKLDVQAGEDHPHSERERRRRSLSSSGRVSQWSGVEKILRGIDQQRIGVLGGTGRPCRLHGGRLTT